MKFWTKPVRWQSVVISAIAAFIVSNAALAASWATVAPWIIVSGTDGTFPQPIKVDSSGSVQTVATGPAADDAAASGNPAPVGGIYNTTLPTYSNLDRTQVQMGARGSINVQIANPDGNTFMQLGADNADGSAATSAAQRPVLAARMWNFNGTSFDRAAGMQNSTNSVGTGITAAGLVGQCDDTSPTAITENSFGNARINCASHAILDERDGDLFLNIVLAAPTTTVVKSGVGRFHKLCINKPAATGVITMYDNTAASGTLIATITQPAALLSSGPICIVYDLAFGTGLTVVTATAAQDLTVTYR